MKQSRAARQRHRDVGALVGQVPAVEGTVGGDGHRIPHLILRGIIYRDGKDIGEIGRYRGEVGAVLDLDVGDGAGAGCI